MLLQSPRCAAVVSASAVFNLSCSCGVNCWSSNCSAIAVFPVTVPKSWWYCCVSYCSLLISYYCCVYCCSLPTVVLLLCELLQSPLRGVTVVCTFAVYMLQGQGGAQLFLLVRIIIFRRPFLSYCFILTLQHMFRKVDV